MACTIAGFRARFTEFASTVDYTDERVQLALDDAALQINRGAWGAKADLGTYYLAAHGLVVDGAAFGGVTPLGAVVGESVGQVSRQYATPGVDITTELRDLAWSKYGILYSRIKRQILATPVVL